jgi:gluconolactonase
MAAVISHVSCLKNDATRASADAGNSNHAAEEFEDTGDRSAAPSSDENSTDAMSEGDSRNSAKDGAGHDAAGSIGESEGEENGDAGADSAEASPSGPRKQWSCPDGPFSTSTTTETKSVCTNFDFNYSYNEGPTWIASQNAFFFSNFRQGRATKGDVIKYTPGGECEVFLHDVGCNGLAVGPTGNLIGACHQPRAIMEFDLATKEAKVLADKADGKMLDSPNDLIAHSNGTIYFTNPTYELDGRPQGLGSALLRIDPQGMVSVIARGGVNGIALSPDEKTLYVVNLGTWSLDDEGVPQRKTGGGPGGDGISVDCAGKIYQMGTNSAFGGTDGKTMIIVGPGTSVRIAQRTVPGLP